MPSRSLIGQAVDSQERTGIERLRDTGRLNYQAAHFQAPQGTNGVGEAVRRFGETATHFYAGYRADERIRADERSNEIIRKLTPEERRAATANGTLLYQDDAEAMEALKFKSGRNAAFEVDTEIRQKIDEGLFKTPQELSDYRQTRMADKAKAYAESVAIDPEDQYFQRGFNADIVSRNAAVFDAHARKLSEQTQAIAQMETVADLGAMFADESFLREDHAPKTFADYFTASLAKGSIPTEGMAVRALQDSLANNAAQPGADAFLKNIGDQQVTLYGQQMKIRDIVGPEVLENYQAKAGEAAFKRNRELTQQFTFGIQDAVSQADPHEGLAMLSKMQGSLNKIQDSNVVTSQTETLNSARGRLLSRIAEDSVVRAKAMTKQIQADNRSALFDTKYSQRINGDNVSTDWKTFETTTDTGEFKEEDAANFAIRKMDELERMSLSPEDRDQMKLKYLRADFAGGPFRKHFETLTTDAVSQYHGLVAAESATVSPENTARIKEFQRLYQADPATIASLYPEQAALAERVGLMERSGIGLETMIDADRRLKGLSREEQILQEQKWATMFSGSDSPVPYLPGALRNAARTLYDSELFRTGDEGAAKKTVDNWLEKSTVSFTTKTDGMDKAVGAIQKRTLMVDPQNAESWRQGRDTINEVVRDLAAWRPWINEGDITITETPNGIVLNDSMSSIDMPPITPQWLRQYYVLKQRKAEEDANTDRSKRADDKIGKYRTEVERRKQNDLKD